MRYRITPLHAGALYFFGDGLITFFKHSKLSDHDYDKLELAAIEPFLSIGIALFILIVDLIIQIATGIIVKGNPIKSIYLIEFAIIAFALVWIWKTFYPTWTI